ncbi:MAG: hypothetical protein KDC38_16215 [Planctomycetes bacterium]|nr:hypothetical protein [Planctomycetota bacterium]
MLHRSTRVVSRSLRLLVGAVVLMALASLPVLADEIVIPSSASTTAGSGAYSTLLNSAPRSYQLVVGPEELTTLPVGASITGITWRRPTWQVFGDWPGLGFTCNFANYDITLSSSLNPPGSLSTTYLENIGPDAVLARAGSWTLTDVYFPGGALTPAVNPFGEVVPFDMPYVYAGGDLLLTIRHTGNDCGGNGSLDTVGSPFAQAIGVSSYTQEIDWYSQGLITMKLEFDPPSGGPMFRRGDANGDGTFDISDAVAILAVLFQGASAPCQNALDVNDDEVSDISDAVYTLAALFTPGSPPPPAPNPDCGSDPTPGALTCDASPSC